MTKEEAASIAKNPHALKGQLREALCYMCGVPFRAVDYKPSDELLRRFEESFCSQIHYRTGDVYRIDHYEYKSLRELLDKVRSLDPDADDERLLANWRYIIQHLPDWYIENNYRLATINKCFTIIINKIRQQNNGKGKVSDDYKRSVAEKLMR